MHSLPKLLVVLGLSIAVRVRFRARDREWIFLIFFPCLKVTNTFVLPSRAGAYLAGVRVNHLETTTSRNYRASS